MAAYGALVSVMHIIDQIHRHPRPPIFIHKQHVQSLTANITFLQEFLQGYNPHVSYSAEADPLESRIAEAAYAAEDVIESYIVDQIHSRSPHHAQEISSTEFEKGMQTVIEEMDLIKVEIKVKLKEKKMRVPIITKSTADAGLSISSSSTAQKVTTMVGFDDALNKMLDKIAGGGGDRQVIPIVGMGGLGKTTLARNVVAHPLMKERFHISAWSTISQVHNTSKILKEILNQVGLDSGGDLSEGDLGEILYKYLFGRRYLIVLDDMWNIEAWNSVRHYFPNNANGSRIVITTRLSHLASMFDYSNGLDMKFLDEANSWNLFCKTVFGEEICPLELEDIAKKIVKACRGLPLSIIVIGGLLSKSEAAREHWEVIEKNLSSIVNAEESGSCLQILYTSYNNLPVHIKTCFLYLGICDEDEELHVHFLISLLVAEGFVKPIDGKSLEEAAKMYLEELAARNLILVEKRNHHGELKKIKVHDLVRDVCLREAEKDKFLCVFGERSIPTNMSFQRRIVFSSKDKYTLKPIIESFEQISPSLVRTLIRYFPHTLPISSFRLLRVCVFDSYFDEENSEYPEGESSDEENTEYAEEESSDEENREGESSDEENTEYAEEESNDEENSEYAEEESSDEYHKDIFIRPVNLRLLVVNVDDYPLPKNIYSSVSSLWNLQTLILLKGSDQYCLLEIWKMPLLRHIMSDGRATLYLPGPPLNDNELDEDVLKNLHTLGEVSNLNFSEGVLERTPNIKKLKLAYHQRREDDEEEEDYSLHNLRCLYKLQDLQLINYSYILVKLMRELTLPHSLKMLVLKGTKLPWEVMKAKIGCLPLLQVLKLENDSFTGSEWETVEGQFSTLKFLLIGCRDLDYWVTDNTHFPHLERLVLLSLTNCEIPSCIGDIPTLRSIKVEDCSDSVDESARRILEEQKELGNEDLRLEVVDYIIKLI